MDNNTERKESMHQAVDTMIHTMRLHHRTVEKRIDGMGVHHGQHRTLMRLSCMGKTASQKEIAAALDVSPACVARTLKALSASGLIEKAEGAQDGRCNEISISPLGLDLVRETHKVFQQIDAEMFAGFSIDEIHQFSALASRLRDNLLMMEQSASDAERSDD